VIRIWHRYALVAVVVAAAPAAMTIAQLGGSPAVAQASQSHARAKTASAALGHKPGSRSPREERLELTAARLKARAERLVVTLSRNRAIGHKRHRLTERAARAIANAHRGARVVAPSAVRSCALGSKPSLGASAKAGPPPPPGVHAQPRFVPPRQVDRLVEKCLDKTRPLSRSHTAGKGA
jgi:hypothetical protein